MMLRSIQWSFTIACCGALFLCCSQAIAIEPIIEYEKRADALVIRMLSFSNYSADGPSILRVFGNGRVLVQRDRTTGRQYFEYYISQQELDELLRFMSDHGAMTYPYGIIQQRLKEEGDRRRAEAYTDRIVHDGPSQPSDGTITRIEVFLKKYKHEKAEGQVQTNFHHQTGGYALGHMARVAPNMPDAQDLGAVAKRLGELHQDQRKKLLSASEIEAVLQVKEPPFPEP